MLPAPRYRTMVVPEDAAEGSRLYVPDVEPYEDALDHAVPIADVRRDWRCDGCGQKWTAVDVACGYCGTGREDV